jgi:hypothetical protein
MQGLTPSVSSLMFQNLDLFFGYRKKKTGAQGRNQPDPRPGSALGTDTRIFSRVYIFVT